MLLFGIHPAMDCLLLPSPVKLSIRVLHIHTVITMADVTLEIQCIHVFDSDRCTLLDRDCQCFTLPGRFALKMISYPGRLRAIRFTKRCPTRAAMASAISDPNGISP